MNWVKKHKLLAIKTIQYDGQLCIELNVTTSKTLELVNKKNLILG